MRLPSPFAFSLTLLLLTADGPSSKEGVRRSGLVVLAAGADEVEDTVPVDFDDEEDGFVAPSGSDEESRPSFQQNVDNDERPEIFADEDEGPPQPYSAPKTFTDEELNAFDADFTTADKRSKMHACLDVTRRYLHDHKESMKSELEAALKRDPEVTEERMISSMVHYFMVGCYFNIDTSTAARVNADLNSLTEPEIQKLVTVGKNKPVQFSKEQETLLTKVASEDEGLNHAAKQEGLNRDFSMRGPSKYLYLIAVLGCGFALAGYAVFTLSKKDRAKNEKKAKKSPKNTPKKRL